MKTLILATVVVAVAAACAAPRQPEVTPAPLAGQQPQAREGATLAGRSTVYAPRGAIATSQPLATSAGLAVLERGGNAVDAAVTAAAVLAIVEPHMTGIGGDMFALVWSARERRVIGLSGHGRSGSDMTREAILARGHERVPPFGAESVTVPGTVRGWADLLERFGTITLAEALAPAIRLAEEGFPVSPVIARQWAESAERLQRDEGARAAYLVDGHRAPAAGEWFRNPDYAASLRAIAEGGADAFYDGPLGRRLVDGLRARGGFLTHDDLRAHRSQWVEPISAEFRGHRVWQIPPPGQGIAALQMLRILEPFELAAMGHNTPEYLHHLIEAKRLAYADLDRFVGDPRHMAVTPERLLADDYIARRRALIRAERAMTEIEPDPALTAGETIYLAVADAEGNMVSFINSLAGAFGSGLVVPGTGFALQNRGVGFSMEEGHANLVAPGKSPFHTIIPGFVTRRNAAGEEEPWLAYGVMGGLIQPQAHAQLLLNLIVFGMDPQEAIDAPRFAHVSELRVWLERPFGEEVRAALGDRGHEVGELPVRFAGGAQLVMRLERGWAAASEPRRDGHAAGH